MTDLMTGLSSVNPAASPVLRRHEVEERRDTEERPRGRGEHGVALISVDIAERAADPTARTPAVATRHGALRVWIRWCRPNRPVRSVRARRSRRERTDERSHVVARE